MSFRSIGILIKGDRLQGSITPSAAHDLFYKIDYGVTSFPIRNCTVSTLIFVGFPNNGQSNVRVSIIEAKTLRCVGQSPDIMIGLPGRTKFDSVVTSPAIRNIPIEVEVTHSNEPVHNITIRTGQDVRFAMAAAAAASGHVAVVPPRGPPVSGQHRVIQHPPPIDPAGYRASPLQSLYIRNQNVRAQNLSIYPQVPGNAPGLHTPGPTPKMKFTQPITKPNSRPQSSSSSDGGKVDTKFKSLRVTIQSGQNIPDDLLDVAVKASLGPSKAATHSLKSAGPNPIWSTTIFLPMDLEVAKTLRFDLWDRGAIAGSRSIAVAKFDVGGMLRTKSQNFSGLIEMESSSSMFGVVGLNVTINPSPNIVSKPMTKTTFDPETTNKSSSEGSSQSSMSYNHVKRGLKIPDILQNHKFKSIEIYLVDARDVVMRPFSKDSTALLCQMSLGTTHSMSTTAAKFNAGQVKWNSRFNGPYNNEKYLRFDVTEGQNAGAKGEKLGSCRMNLETLFEHQKDKFLALVALKGANKKVVGHLQIGVVLSQKISPTFDFDEIENLRVFSELVENSTVNQSSEILDSASAVVAQSIAADCNFTFFSNEVLKSVGTLPSSSVPIQSVYSNSSSKATDHHVLPSKSSTHSTADESHSKVPKKSTKLSSVYPDAASALSPPGSGRTVSAASGEFSLESFTFADQTIISGIGSGVHLPSAVLCFEDGTAIADLTDSESVESEEDKIEFGTLGFKSFQLALLNAKDLNVSKPTNKLSLQIKLGDEQLDTPKVPNNPNDKIDLGQMITIPYKGHHFLRVRVIEHREKNVCIGEAKLDLKEYLDGSAPTFRTLMLLGRRGRIGGTLDLSLRASRSDHPLRSSDFVSPGFCEKPVDDSPKSPALKSTSSSSSDHRVASSSPKSQQPPSIVVTSAPNEMPRQHLKLSKVADVNISSRRTSNSSDDPAMGPSHNYQSIRVIIRNGKNLDAALKENNNIMKSFVRVAYNGQKMKTDVSRLAVGDPDYNSVVTFPMDPTKRFARLQIFGKSREESKDKLSATAKVDLEPFIYGGFTKYDQLVTMNDVETRKSVGFLNVQFGFSSKIVTGPFVYRAQPQKLNSSMVATISPDVLQKILEAPLDSSIAQSIFVGGNSSRGRKRSSSSDGKRHGKSTGSRQRKSSSSAEKSKSTKTSQSPPSQSKLSQSKLSQSKLSQSKLSNSTMSVESPTNCVVTIQRCRDVHVKSVYVRAAYGKEEQTTPVGRLDGNATTFDPRSASFTFAFNKNSTLKLETWHKSRVKNKIVGTCDINVRSLLKGNRHFAAPLQIISSRQEIVGELDVAVKLS